MSPKSLFFEVVDNKKNCNQEKTREFYISKSTEKDVEVFNNFSAKLATTIYHIFNTVACLTWRWTAASVVAILVTGWNIYG